MSVWYLDTSAAAKLVRRERETSALRTWLGSRTWVLSDLHRTELRRAARRAGAATLARAERFLDEAQLMRIDPNTFDLAGRLDDAVLRSLDALHLAAAQQLGRDLAGVVTYDRRQAAAAEAVGIPVSTPS